MAERRYGDDEVREIFSLATTCGTHDRPLSAEPGGLTIDELQRIGREAGIEPARVAQAAQTLDARGRAGPVRRSFGLPVGVSRLVDLPRAPTHREWEQLISRFRTTFGIRGRATTTEGLREWSYGNLHICVEPTEHGDQLRLTTFMGDVSAYNAIALMFVGLGLIMGALVASGGKPEKALIALATMSAIGLGTFGYNLARLPRWARERDRQMQDLAEYAVKLLSKP